MENIFELLHNEPILSISLGFVSAVILAIVFKDVIVEIIKKKFGLYSEDDIREAVEENLYNKEFVDNVIEQLKR